jgi:hypothetical protein
MLAEILVRCGKPKLRSKVQAPPPNTEGRRERFAESLSQNDPDYAKRLAAFDAMTTDRCAGFPDVEYAQEDLTRLYEAGAAGGDPKSRAALVHRAVVRQLVAPDRDPAKHPSVTDAQVQTLKESFASGDPYAMQTALQIFNFPLQNLSLRAGPNQVPVDTSALHGAVTLASCSFGYPCGPDLQQILVACAMRGECAANDYREYLFFYGSSPAASQRIGEYTEALLNAARHNDWSYFTFHPGPSPAWAGSVRSR